MRKDLDNRSLTMAGYTISFVRGDAWLPRGGIDFSLVTPSNRQTGERRGGYPADGSSVLR